MSIRPVTFVIKQRDKPVALLQTVEADTRPRRKIVTAKFLIVHLEPTPISTLPTLRDGDKITHLTNAN